MSGWSKPVFEAGPLTDNFKDGAEEGPVDGNVTVAFDKLEIVLEDILLEVIEKEEVDAGTDGPFVEGGCPRGLGGGFAE